MSKIKEFQKKLKQRTKFDIIKSLFQAFTVTVVAVVAVTVFIPNSPLASFDKVKAFSHEIIYQLNVQDVDNIVQDNEIKLIAESQYGRVEKIISIGDNYGSFTDLRKNTLYNLKVVYDKGFGEETLAKETVTTIDELVGAITSIDSENFGQYSFYNIGITYGVIEGYSDWQLRYATIYPDYPEEQFYNTLLLLDLETNVELEFYPSPGATYHIILEAMYEGQMVQLDEVSLKAPFSVSGWLYLVDYTDQEAEFYIYGDEVLDIPILYTLEVFQNGIVVETFEFDSLTNMSEESFIVDGLTPDTDYYFLLKAWYRNPETLLEEHSLLSQVSMRTLPEVNDGPVVVENPPVVIVELLKVFNTELVYQINITDFYQIVLPEQMKVILSTETESYEQTVEVGNSFGSFTGLTAGVEYEFKVVIDQGLGQAILLTQNVVTTDELIATVSGFEEISAIPYSAFYNVGITYGNTTGYTDWQLRYAGINFDYPLEAYYDTVILEPNQTLVGIEFYDSSLGEYHLILEANYNGSLVIVDESRIRAPFMVSGSLYLESYTDREASIWLYADTSIYADIDYTLEVYNGSFLEQSIDITELSYQTEFSFTLTNLIPETNYNLVFKTNYLNPDTLYYEEGILSETPLLTNPDVVVPANLTAVFEDIKIFSTEVVYQMNVTDVDNIIEVGQLKLVLDDGFTQVVQDVYLGDNFGSFSSLTPETNYTLNLIYDLGYGQEIILTEAIYTTNELVATISSFELSSFSQGTMKIYNANISYGNTLGYSAWQIRYAVVVPGLEQEAYYETFMLQDGQTAAEIVFYENYGEEYYIILEAYFDGNLVVVDETRVSLPFMLYASMYVSFYTDIDALLNFYVETPVGVTVDYSLEVLNFGVLEQDLLLDMEAIVANGGDYQVYNLTPDSDYSFVFKATYINPDTGRLEEVIVYEEFIHTYAIYPPEPA